MECFRIANTKMYHVIYLTRKFLRKCTRIYWPFVNCVTVRESGRRPHLPIFLSCNCIFLLKTNTTVVRFIARHAHSTCPKILLLNDRKIGLPDRLRVVKLKAAPRLVIINFISSGLSHSPYFWFNCITSDLPCVRWRLNTGIGHQDVFAPSLTL